MFFEIEAQYIYACQCTLTLPKRRKSSQSGLLLFIHRTTGDQFFLCLILYRGGEVVVGKPCRLSIFVAATCNGIFIAWRCCIFTWEGRSRDAPGEAGYSMSPASRSQAAVEGSLGKCVCGFSTVFRSCIAGCTNVSEWNRCDTLQRECLRCQWRSQIYLYCCVSLLFLFY